MWCLYNSLHNYFLGSGERELIQDIDSNKSDCNHPYADPEPQYIIVQAKWETCSIVLVSGVNAVPCGTCSASCCEDGERTEHSGSEHLQMAQ